jgi:hypothetical protein
MKLTIVPSDDAIYVDGVVSVGLAIATPSTVRALQWDGAAGHIEYTNGQVNLPITELPAWAIAALAIRDAFVAERERVALLPPSKSVLIGRIKSERDRRKFNGVNVSGKWLHTDTYSRTQWLGMVLMGANLPAIEWTTMDGTSVTTTPTLAGQVFQGTAMLDAAVFAHAKSLIAQVEASTDPGSVDITTGWLATYGDA